MDYELMFEVEHEGVTYTIGIDKVGGGTVGQRYDCEYWDWYSEPDSGEEERTGRFYVGGSATHFQAATTFLQMLEEREVELTEDLSAYVDKGVELLDSIFPRWRELIDVDTLDMGDIHNCVLGQIFGYYSRGMEILGNQDSDVDGDTYGFDSSGSKRYDDLAELWKRAVG